MTQKPDRCIGCPLYDEEGPVPGFGNPDARIFFVGEAPGKTEAKMTGRPFTGGSGRLLTALMENAGIHRKDVFLSNVVRCRPIARSATGAPLLNKQGETVDASPSKEAIIHCAPFLHEELVRVKPTLVVALGATALYAFKDVNTIGKHRGIPFALANGQKVLATFHPAALMRQQAQFPAVVTDLRTAAREATFPEVRRMDVEYSPDATVAADGESLLSRIRAAGHVSIDWETTGGTDPRSHQIVCAGAGTEPFKGECYDWTDSTQRLFRDILVDPTIEKIGQNSEDFDWRFWEDKTGLEVLGPTFDTLLGFHLVSPDLPKNLENIATYYANDVEPWKGPKMYKAGHHALKVGNCRDVDVTLRAAIGIKKELALLGLTDLYMKSVMPLQPVLRRMTRAGLRKDTEKAVKWGMALEFSADKDEQTLRAGLDNASFNVQSSKQLMELFYDKLGLPVQYTKDKNHGMRPTANADAMERLAEITRDPIFHLVNRIRTKRKYKSTYCEIESDDNGYTHPHFGCAKAANGRLNSWDFNGQNVPIELRELWIPDTPEHVFVSADWSQVEWRIDMALSADESGLTMFAENRDMHRWISSVFGTPYDEVTEDQRHESKFVVYGWAYGRGARSIAEKHQKEEAWVKNFLAGLERRFPSYCAIRRMREKQVADTNYLANPFRRRRWWYSRQVTEIYNFQASSTAADMMYLVLPKVERELPKGASLRLTVHDELVACAPKELAVETAHCIKDNMQRVFNEVMEASVKPHVVKKYYPNGWYAPADVSFGLNWKQCKPKSAADKQWQRDFRKQIGYA